MSVNREEKAVRFSAKYLAQQVKQFVNESVLPHELALAQGDDQSNSLLLKLTKQAQELSLSGIFYPLDWGGKLDSLEDYLLVAEQEGRTEFSQTIFASHSALDAHMLLRFGGSKIKEDFLRPLSLGHAVPSYGMTEPDQAGSVPSSVSTFARRDGDDWVINGRKWFICNVDRSDFITLLVKTDSEKEFSMFVVPTNAPGFKVERELTILGRSQGQGEISLTDVRVPSEYLLGVQGQGLVMAGTRLAMGRVLRASHWIGLAQRCFEIMCDRINSERGSLTRLPEKQLVKKYVFDSYQAIVSARQMLCLAARSIDRNHKSDIEVNSAKYAASHALCLVADLAIQLHGAEGVSDLTPLSGIYRNARTTRILDGADESLISSIGNRLLKQSIEGHYDFSYLD